MKYRRPSSNAVLETRIDYIESRLDEAISSLKEAIRDNKEAIRDNKEAMLQMESRHRESIADIKEMVKDNKEALEKVVIKTESSRRWSIGIVITIAITVIGFMASVLGFMLTNGFQIPT